MKKVISIFLLSAFAALTIQAQNQSFKQFFKQFSKEPEATRVVITKPFIWLLKFAQTEAETEEEQIMLDMMQNISSFRLVTIPGETADLKDKTKEARKFLRTEMEPLMEIKDGKDHFTISILEKGDLIREVGMLIHSPEEIVLIQVRGKFDLEQISHLSKGISTHAGKESLSMDDMEINESIELYPNPCSGELIQITLPEKLVHSDFRIADMEGKLIRSGKINSSQMEIETKDLAKGNYILHISSGDQKGYSKKFTIR